jgi:23S rRNA (cytosine1962-C5)-methyltransferase
MNARVVLQARMARPFYGRHPWVYPGAIRSVEGQPADGDVVDLVTNTGSFVARGLYNSQSKLRVRLYTWNSEVALDRAFFRSQIEAAIRLRHILGLLGPGQACRVVCSEGDGLSGCIVDRYDRWLMLQTTALGIAVRREMLVELLVELLQPEGVYLRTERGIGQLEGLEAQDGLLWGRMPEQDGESIPIADGGLRILVNLAEGQKTGYYLDQRDNRHAVARLASHRRVLDAFCYSGGFGLHAAKAGAAEVVGVDVSEPALNLARANAQLNGLDHMDFVRADVFEYLDAAGRNERFGMVVFDPPRFARARNAVEEALRGYRRLLLQGLRVLEADGILVMCCCSGLITPEMLEEVLAQAAAEGNRDVQLLQRRGPAADHPVSVSCLESHYLKCLICRVR